MIYKKTVFIQFLLLAILFSACAKQSNALITGYEPINQKPAKYKVKDGLELNALSLMPGDTVIMLNGNWRSQQINFKGKGTEQKPIVLLAETPGMVLLTGNSNLKIDGTWLIVDGLSFKDGYSLKDDVVIFSKNTSHCRLTNTNIKDYNPLNKATDYKWVSLYGQYNRLDHCSLIGKTNSGTTLVVWLADKPNYHEIDHNYFGPRPPLGVNGGETIRIGTSTWSMYDSYTKVSFNIFDKCDGEVETISIKSGHNLISNNLFFECEGTVTFRHGNNSEVSYNYFIGNNKKNAGGIRIIGENHKVHHNYLQGLPGRGLRAAISLMNGLEKPELHEYFPVKNAEVHSNIIVDCREAFVFGAGKNDQVKVAPDNLTIRNNYIIDPGSLLVKTDNPTNLFLENNQVRGAALSAGFIKMSTDLHQEDGIWQLKTETKIPFWINVPVGPSWQDKVKLTF